MNIDQMKVATAAIEAAYDPENDYHNPRVTHTERQLLAIIESLVQRIENLETRMDFYHRGEIDFK